MISQKFMEILSSGKSYPCNYQQDKKYSVPTQETVCMATRKNSVLTNISCQETQIRHILPRINTMVLIL